MNRIVARSTLLALGVALNLVSACSDDPDNTRVAGQSDVVILPGDVTTGVDTTDSDGTASPDGVSPNDVSPDDVSQEDVSPDDVSPEEDATVEPLDCGALNRETLAGGGCGACTAGSDEIVLDECSSTVEGDGCLQVFDDDELRGVTISCADTPSVCRFDDAECAEGCIERVGFGFLLDAPARIGAVRFSSDWWSKRPNDWEVWVAEREGQFPGGGAVMVASGNAQPNPWQCVTGEACSEEVPDVCCPDGRDAPQRIEEGALIPKFDIATFYDSEVEGVQVYFEVRSSYLPSQFYLNDLRFYSAECVNIDDECTDACADGVTCEVVEGSPVCGDCPIGTSGDGETCTDVDGCEDSPCFEGVACTDEPAPSTGYTCGPCPAGTSGDGETCTSDTCTPACESWQTCVSGSCRANSCGGQGACPGAVCFEGTCQAGTTCADACTSRYGAGSWECVGDGRCRNVACRTSTDCGFRSDCVSDSNNPRGTFDQTCSGSPCGGACVGSQLCSAEREECFP